MLYIKYLPKEPMNPTKSSAKKNRTLSLNKHTTGLLKKHCYNNETTMSQVVDKLIYGFLESIGELDV